MNETRKRVDDMWAKAQAQVDADRAAAAPIENIFKGASEGEPVLDAPEDKPKEKGVQLTASDDFLPYLDEAKVTHDLQAQAWDDHVSKAERRPGTIGMKYLKPGHKTIRGIDVATGERKLNRGQVDNELAQGEYKSGIEKIRNSTYNPKDGYDYDGVRGLVDIASGILEESADRAEFMTAIDRMNVPEAQAKFAWAAAVDAKEIATVKSYLEGEAAGGDYDMEADIEEDITREQLPEVEGWADAARMVYAADNGQEFEGDDAALIDWYVDEMSNLNWKMTQFPLVNTSSLGAYAKRAFDNGPEYAQALLTLSETYDRVKTDWGIAGNTAAALAGDPASWFGFGAGAAGAKIAGAVAKNRFRKLVGLAITGAIEGSVYGGADNLGRQDIRIAAGEQEGIDMVEAGVSTALGASIGAVAAPAIAKGVEVVSPYVVAAARKARDNARRMPARGRMGAQIGAVGTNLKTPFAPTLDTAITVARSKPYPQQRVFKAEMQEIAKNYQKATGIDLTKDTPESNSALADLMVRDAQAALENNANAVGWYDETIRATMKILEMIHPELATNKDAKFAFSYALANTSNGLKVDKNFELAEMAYREWKSTGKMPVKIGIGNAAAAINKTFQMFNTLVDKFGIEAVENIWDSKMTVRELTAMGFKISGELVDQEVYGAAAMGPKIGNGFYANLRGKFDQLTMDRWFIRTWGRHTGTLIEDRPDMVKKKSAELTTSIKQLMKSPAQVKAFQELGVDLSLPVEEVAAQIQKASMLPKNRTVMNKTKAGQTARKAGNSLTKWIDGQKEAPANGKERARIRKVFNEVREKLGMEELTMSDLQAVLWYAEKRLYDNAKAKSGNIEGYVDDEAPDYANAAAQLARKLGFDDESIAAADSAGRAGGRARNDSAGSGKPGPGGGGPGSDQPEDLRILEEELNKLGTLETDTSGHTQVATTIGSYRKINKLLDEVQGEGPTLDYGAGLGRGSKELGFDDFEPNPKEGYEPKYNDSAEIPDESYSRIANLNVLNVVPPTIRAHIVSEIGRILKPGGTAVITARAWKGDVASNKNFVDLSDKIEPNSMITMKDKTYQHGFEAGELVEYLQTQLGPDFEVVNKGGIGARGAIVRKLK